MDRDEYHDLLGKIFQLEKASAELTNTEQVEKLIDDNGQFERIKLVCPYCALTAFLDGDSMPTFDPSSDERVLFDPYYLKFICKNCDVEFDGADTLKQLLELEKCLREVRSNYYVYLEHMVPKGKKDATTENGNVEEGGN